MRDAPPFATVVPDYASPDDGATRARGLRRLMLHYTGGCAIISLLAFGALAWFVAASRTGSGGYGLEGFVLAAVFVALIVLNLATAGAVWLGASMKANRLRTPVAAHGLLCGVVGTFSPIAAAALMWLGSGFASALGVPWFAALLLACAPSAVAGFFLARPVAQD